MNRRTLLAGAALLLLIAAAVAIGLVVINSREGPSAPRAGPASPDTPAPSPHDPRAEVEQAYLRFWDIWTQANLTLDPKLIEQVTTGKQLELLSEQLEEQRTRNQPVKIAVEHSYEVLVTGSSTASVEDRYVNHSVRLDPRTMQPIEPDPNIPVRKSHTLRKADGRWKVAEIIEYR